ncbi:MAG: flagellar export chaperone FlgN [Gemmatimonadaceae bacterium]
MNMQTLGPGRTTASQGNALLEGLIDSLLTERRLVEDLTVIMLRQRAAVAAEDLQGVDDSVYAVQRVLLTLGESRKRRHTINARLGFSEDIALRDLIEVMGSAAPDALRAASRQLQNTARALAKEVGVNRQVLRESLASGDAYVRAITATTPRVGYGESLGAPDGSQQARLFNRRV